MKKTIVISLILVAGVSIFLIRSSSYSLFKNTGAKVKAERRTAPVEPRTIHFKVTVSGEITPAKQVSVRPEVNGRIAKLQVDIGDKVKKGDVLFTLDDKDLQIEIAQRQAEIDSAKIQLEKVQRDFDRDKRLFEEDLISREVFDDSKTQLELAQNAIFRAQRALELAMERLQKTQIIAPFDCTILTRPVSEGQAVSGSGGFNSGTEVLTIANLNAMVINAHVNQADITRLKAGQNVTIQVEAVSGLAVPGVVERISPQATIKNNIKGFEARIVLSEIDPRIQPGMTANITIPVASAEGVLAVPLAAVFTEHDQDSGQMERYVYVQKGAKFERRPVQIGVSDFFHAEVISGLAAGETVAVEMPEPGSIIESPEIRQPAPRNTSGGAVRSSGST